MKGLCVAKNAVISRYGQNELSTFDHFGESALAATRRHFLRTSGMSGRQDQTRNATVIAKAEGSRLSRQ